MQPMRVRAVAAPVGRGVEVVADGLRLEQWWFPTLAANGAARMGHPGWWRLMEHATAETDSLRQPMRVRAVAAPVGRGVGVVADGLRLGQWWFPTLAANGAARMGHPRWWRLMENAAAEADSLQK